MNQCAVVVCWLFKGELKLYFTHEGIDDESKTFKAFFSDDKEKAHIFNDITEAQLLAHIYSDCFIEEY